jgi:MFS transporter, FSR family, fosmidomycin resistance protein
LNERIWCTRDLIVASKGSAISSEQTRTTTSKTTPRTAERDDAQPAEYNARGTWIASGAHFAHDLYPSFIGVLVPAVQAKLGIPLAMAALMVPAQQMPSVLQPFIGYFADRTSKKLFVVLTPATAAVSLSMIGLAPSLWVILLLLLVSGLSSAAFHAPTISLVGEYGGNKMGRAMAIFMAGGEMSRTIGPLIITAAIALFTLEGSAVVMVFGIAASVILYFTIDTTQSDAAARSAKHARIRPLIKARLRPLTGLFGYSIVKAVATVPFHFFLVAMLIDKGRGPWYAGIALSFLFGAGVIGGFIGGSVSDRFGRKQTLTIVALATTPLFYLYLFLENGSWWVISVLVLAGMVSMSVRPISLAQAQELMPEARGPMAGMMLATGFVTMSIASIGFGALADWIGIQTAFWIISALPIAALPFIAMLPQHGEPLAKPR